MQKEAKARIKINKLLEESGWRFEDEKGTTSIALEKIAGVLGASIKDLIQ